MELRLRNLTIWTHANLLLDGQKIKVRLIVEISVFLVSQKIQERFTKYLAEKINNTDPLGVPGGKHWPVSVKLSSY